MSFVLSDDDKKLKNLTRNLIEDAGGTEAAAAALRKRVAVKPDDPRLEGLTIAPFPRDWRAAVKAAFEARVAAGLPVVGRAGTVAIDDASQGRMTAAAVMAQVGAWPEAGFWRLSDNTNLPLGAGALMALCKVAGTHFQALFAARSALLDRIAADEAVDPEAGWPEPAPFNPAA